MQLVGVVCECKHLNHGVQNHHDSGRKRTISILLPKATLRHFVLSAPVVLNLRNARPTAEGTLLFRSGASQDRPSHKARQPPGARRGWLPPVLRREGVSPPTVPLQREAVDHGAEDSEGLQTHPVTRRRPGVGPPRAPALALLRGPTYWHRRK